MNTFIDIHTHIKSGEPSVTEILNIQPEDPFPGGFCSSALHPWLIPQTDIEQAFSLLEQKISAGHLKAVGECGLDRPNFAKSAPSPPADRTQQKENGQRIQTEIFRRHIELANFAELPLVIHCVRAYPEIIQIRKSFNSTTPWIIHGFRGSPETAAELIKNEIYLSFGKTLLHHGPLSDKLAETFRKIPQDKFFLESDNTESPSVSIAEIYRTAAEIRNTPLPSLIQQLKQNFLTVFGKTANFAD